MIPKYAHLLDRTTRYLEAGEGRACVLLHGYPLSADQWLPQLHRVPPSWRFIAPDMRGFRGIGTAYQEVGLESSTIATHAADVLQLMNHLDVDRAVIVGLSMGGYVALALARAAASRLDGLVLADTRAGGDGEETRAARDAAIAAVRAGGVAAIAEGTARRLLGETSCREQPDLVEAVRTLILRNGPDGIIAAQTAIKQRPDATPGLAAIACPTLVVWGEEDTVTPLADSEALALGVPGASLVRLPAAGHLSNLEAPMAFTAALGAFLDRIS